MTKADALLAIWHDVEDAFVGEYLRWHSLEHLPERLALPGFLAAHRLEHASGPGQRFLCLIDVRQTADLASPDYLARLNAPTEWTRRLMPRYGNVQRALHRVLFRTGDGIGPETACLRFNLNPTSRPETASEVLRLAVADATSAGAVVAARLAAVDEALGADDTEERRLRRAETTGGFDYLLTMDGLAPGSLRDAAAAVGERIAETGARVASSVYRFSYAARA